MNEKVCLILEKIKVNVKGETKEILKYVKSCSYLEEEDIIKYEDDIIYNISFIKSINSKYYFCPLDEVLKDEISTTDIETILLKVDEYFDEQYFAINEDKENNNKFEVVLVDLIVKKLTIKDIYENIISVIKGQDEHVKSVLSSIIFNQNLNNSSMSLNEISKNKHNILIMGPTGVGKTEIVRQISENINIPMTVVDATDYTKTGYVGKNVEDMLISLYKNADGNLELAQHSILVIDEFDKLAKSNDKESSVNSTGVQRTLLKLIEGTTKNIDIENRTISFDTRGLTIILLGAFPNLEEKNTRLVGFNIDNGFRQKDIKTLPNLVEKLSKYGIEDEMLGRINRIIKLNKMTKEVLFEILKSPKGRLMTLVDIFKTQNVTFDIDEFYLEEIVNMALKDNKGARSLNRIIDEIISEDFNAVMFEEKKHIKIRSLEKEF